jgi:hypothetical protein
MNREDIYSQLVKGKSVEDLTEEFFENLEWAVARYEEYQAQQEAKKAEQEKRTKAREALGAAWADYMKSYGIDVKPEDMLYIDDLLAQFNDIDPRGKVVRFHIGKK